MTLEGKDEVIGVLQQLVLEWRQGTPSGWENRTVPDYLEAMAAWLQVYEQAYTNLAEPPPTDGWAVFAAALRAAAIYE